LHKKYRNNKREKRSVALLPLVDACFMRDFWKGPARVEEISNGFRWVFSEFSH
jgi:hypothetical protein